MTVKMTCKVMPKLLYIERTLVVVVFGGCQLGVKPVLIYSCPDPTLAPLYH